MEGLNMFYAERIENCEIVERGVFLSIEEFLPYREKGWSGTPDTDAMADQFIIENLAGESLEDMGLVEHFEEAALKQNTTDKG